MAINERRQAMLQRDFDKKYREQTDAYRGLFSRSEFEGQRTQNQRRSDMRMATDKLLEGGNLKDLPKEQRREIVSNATPVSFSGREGNQFYSRNEKDDRVLMDMTEANNPFAELKGDGGSFGRGAGSNRALLGRVEAARYIKEGGHDAADVLSHFQEKGTKISNRAQKYLNNKVAAQIEKDKKKNNQGNTGDTTNIGDVTSVGNDEITAGKGNNVIGDSGNIAENSFNTARGDNIARDTGDIYNQGGFNFGTQNTGVIDYSVQIGGGSQGGSGSGGGLDNLKSGIALQALNENAYEQSRAKMDGTSNAAKYIGLANLATGADARVKGIDMAINKKSLNYKADANNYLVGLFGDVGALQFPRFQSSGPNEPIESQYL